MTSSNNNKVRASLVRFLSFAGRVKFQHDEWNQNIDNLRYHLETVRNPDGTLCPDVLFVGHVDTVDPDQGHRTQDVVLDKRTGKLSLKYHPVDLWGYKSTTADRVPNCLGADDKAGVWIMLQMIQAKVPGHYLFTDGEESGAIGIRQFVDDHGLFLESIKAAVEFDRRGTTEVVWDHATGPSATIGFAKRLASALGPQWVSSNGGSFTDICYLPKHIMAVNLSAGYQNAHSRMETLDTRHVLMLRKIFTDRNIGNTLLKLCPDAQELEAHEQDRMLDSIPDSNQMRYYQKHGTSVSSHWNANTYDSRPTITTATTIPVNDLAWMMSQQEVETLVKDPDYHDAIALWLYRNPDKLENLLEFLNQKTITQYEPRPW